jgi:UDP-glucose 4-epimerase
LGARKFDKALVNTTIVCPPSMALRYFNAAGADPDGQIGEAHDPETHLIPLVLAAARTGTPVRIFGTDYDTPTAAAYATTITLLISRTHTCARWNIFSPEARAAR